MCSASLTGVSELHIANTIRPDAVIILPLDDGLSAVASFSGVPTSRGSHGWGECFICCLPWSFGRWPRIPFETEDLSHSCWRHLQYFGCSLRNYAETFTYLVSVLLRICCLTVCGRHLFPSKAIVSSVLSIASKDFMLPYFTSHISPREEGREGGGLSCFFFMF